MKLIKILINKTVKNSYTSFKSFNGNKMMVFSKSKITPIVNPNNLKGKRTSQIKG